MFSTDVDNIYIYIMLKESKSGRKIVVLKNFDFNIQKISCALDFFGLGYKFFTNFHKHIIWILAYQIFEFPYGTKTLRKYKW